MSTGALAAVVSLAVAVAAVGSVVVVVAAVRTLAHMRTTLTSVRTAVEELRREGVPLLTDLRGVTRQLSDELARLDTLLDTAESIGDNVDSASRLTYMAVANPVVKAMSLATGASKALRRLRGKGADQLPGTPDGAGPA